MKRMKLRKKFMITAISSAASATVITCVIHRIMFTSPSYKSDLISGYNEVAEYIDEYYYKEPETENYVHNALKGLVAGLGDSYAAYMTPEEYGSNIESLQGSFAGIGITLIHNEEKQFVIIDIVKDSPASRANIKKDDMITKINNVPTNNMDMNQIVSLVKGPEGTEVTLTIKRNEKEFDVVLKREIIESDTVEYKMLENNIGYIKITAFKDVTSEQFETAVNTAFNEGAEKLIYDLRDNGGGTLSSCEAMLDPLLPKGDIAYAQYRDGSEIVICTSDEKEINVPTVILVNENTASASELFASAMRDFDKAELVGTTTFGKGIMQNTIQLSNGGGLRITVAEYRTAKSDCFHEEGLTPDYVIEMPEDADITSADPQKDPQLKKAVEILK